MNKTILIIALGILSSHGAENVRPAARLRPRHTYRPIVLQEEYNEETAPLNVLANVAAEIPYLPPARRQQEHTCDICGKSYHSKAELKRHIENQSHRQVIFSLPPDQNQPIMPKEEYYE